MMTEPAFSAPRSGAYGGEMKDVLTTVQYLTAEGEVKEAAAVELDLRYRPPQHF